MIVSDTLTDTPLPEKSTCVALGLFDGLHLGHRAVLEKAVSYAKKEGLSTCVFTYSMDEVPASKLKATTLQPERLNEAMFEAMGIDYILRPPFTEFCGLAPADFVRQVLRERLGARAVACGSYFRFGKNAAGDGKELAKRDKEHGMKTMLVPMVNANGAPISSTRIRGLIAKGEIPEANELLGHRFAIDFTVVHGRKLGRKLDWPTINQPFPENFTIPRFGVYATLVLVDGVWRGGVTNVGRKPTVGSDAILAETYISGYEGDLYGKDIQVEFLQFIRPEQKFDSIEELRANIRRDAATSEHIRMRYL